jgi:hypothetical protein
MVVVIRQFRVDSPQGYFRTGNALFLFTAPILLLACKSFITICTDGCWHIRLNHWGE